MPSPSASEDACTTNCRLPLKNLSKLCHFQGFDVTLGSILQKETSILSSVKSKQHRKRSGQRPVMFLLALRETSAELSRRSRLEGKLVSGNAVIATRGVTTTVFSGSTKTGTRNKQRFRQRSQITQTNYLSSKLIMQEGHVMISNEHCLQDVFLAVVFLPVKTPVSPSST